MHEAISEATSEEMSEIAATLVATQLPTKPIDGGEASREVECILASSEDTSKNTLEEIVDSL